MKKVLITGACGYLGARLSKHLAENGHRVTAFDCYDPSEYTHWSSLMEEVVIGDIRDEATISNLAGKQFDVVIHLVSLDHHKSEESPGLVSSINVLPTWNLLDKLTKNGLEKFIYFSTIHVYGRIPSKVITEKQLPAPGNAYGLTHLLSENICNYYQAKTDTCCINVRLSNSYGSPLFQENNCWWLVINDLCKTAFEENKIKLLSDGSPQRDFIHGSDVCRAVEVLMARQKDSILDNIFHIASGKTLTILELAHEVKKVFTERFHKEIEIILPDNTVSDDPDKFRDADKYTIDNAKLTILGFQPETSLYEGFRELFGFLTSRQAHE